MADITDPTIIAWTNTVVRPIADRMVGLNATTDIELATWFATITGLLSTYATSSVILDGSESDGRTPLTKQDVTAFVTQMLAYQTQLNGAGVFDVVNKPKVNIIMP